MMRHLFSNLMKAALKVKPDAQERVNASLKKALENAPVIPDREEKPAAPAKPAEKAPSGNIPPITHPVRNTSKAGIDLMHQFEGCAKMRPDGKVEAYFCPAGVWTIGWGSTGNDPFNGGKIRKGTVWTQEQCDTRFEQHLAQFERAVLDGLAGKPASQAQFDAMVCLTYNIGPAAFSRSTVLRKHRAGDYPGAAKAFLMWNKGGGKVLRGLTRRREAESALYRSGS